MGKIIDFLKRLFAKKPAIDCNVESNTKSIKKIKKNKASIDNSQDYSFNNNGMIVNQNATSIYSESSKDLLVSARWNHLVPHKFEQVRNGIDSFNVLQPVDKSFLPAEFEVNIENSNNRENAIYFLIKRNNFIKNLHIKSITIKNGNETIEIIKEKKDLYGLLDKDKSFLIVHDDLIISACNIDIEFGFEVEQRSCKQNFTFIASSNSREFIMPKYNDAELDIDWSHFTF